MKALAASLFLFAGACAEAQEPKTELASRLDRLISDRFPGTKCPGLSVAVIERNQLVFSTALGMADIEQGVPLKKTSVHRLASLSKPITGTIIMDLVVQRKLSLDAPVRRYLPELPKTYEPVTLRQLL
ncbi:MAG: beta-lactamase family protein, partial [Acidobacteriaceae bacterium]|nr:beta-lactamase family protein [Acidobacteriaceae bacterium]